MFLYNALLHGSQSTRYGMNHFRVASSGGRCEGFDMKMIFYSHANKTSTRNFYKKGLGLTLKVKVFETRKWPIYNNHSLTSKNTHLSFP